MNEVEKAKALLQIMHLNDKSNYYFWGTVLSTVGVIVTTIAAFKVGYHFFFLSAAFWVVARLILMPKGIECNRQARALLESIPD